MTQIILTSEQISLLSQEAGPVLLVDAGGRRVGQAVADPDRLHDFSEEMEPWDRAADDDFKSFLKETEQSE